MASAVDDLKNVEDGNVKNTDDDSGKGDSPNSKESNQRDIKAGILERGVKGNVKWFSFVRGYGFITPTDHASFKSDIFFHHTAIIPSSRFCRPLILNDGDPVEFDVAVGLRDRIEAIAVSGPNGAKIFPVRAPIFYGRLPPPRNMTRAIDYGQTGPRKPPPSNNKVMSVGSQDKGQRKGPISVVNGDARPRVNKHRRNGHQMNRRGKENSTNGQSNNDNQKKVDEQKNAEEEVVKQSDEKKPEDNNADAAAEVQ